MSEQDRGWWALWWALFMASNPCYVRLTLLDTGIHAVMPCYGLKQAVEV